MGYKRCWLPLVLLAAGLPSWAADAEAKAGGVTLVLPAPAADFAEVGDRLRSTFFDLLAPGTNRVLTAYLPAAALAALNGGEPPGKLDVYGLVEVARQAEYADCGPEDFAQIVKGLEPTMGAFDPQKLGDMEQELNIHLKSLGSKPVELGHPEMLGSILQNANAAEFAMLMALKANDKTVTMAVGVGFLRVRQRLVFAYLYRPYESADSVAWLRKNMAAWCDAILAANQ